MNEVVLTFGLLVGGGGRCRKVVGAWSKKVGGISNWRCLRSPQDVPVLDGIVEHRYQVRFVGRSEAETH